MLPSSTCDGELIFTESPPPLLDSSSPLTNNKTPSSSSSSSSSPITESPQTSNSDISSIRSDSKTSSPSKSPSKTKTRKKYVKRACVNCKQSHAACDSERPCKRCVSLGMGDKCVDAVRKKSKNDSSNEEKRKKQKPNETQPSNPQFPFYNPMENNLMTPPNTALIGNQMLMIPMLTTATVPTIPINAPSSSSTNSIKSQPPTQSNWKCSLTFFTSFFSFRFSIRNSFTSHYEFS
ncbi:predicted protein [Naegleria gruberi]|uniref:Predicted protein n=1 Tax=Naegleria gruberi TaxID=5762 RepID=D2V8L7_NAEGR|nr:uncharacterized protein NAEGRDRAFT_65203 [Naegleria gruberi]EFC46827.1 predicted protein [Naegleria gruberi]|eukprot:XP_002679571.1 predicted protein [Naegleria gruberi strain NEG-M]